MKKTRLAATLTGASLACFLAMACDDRKPAAWPTEPAPLPTNTEPVPPTGTTGERNRTYYPMCSEAHNGEAWGTDTLPCATWRDDDDGHEADGVITVYLENGQTFTTDLFEAKTEETGPRSSRAVGYYTYPEESPEIVAIVTAPTEDTYTVDYQDGEWLFSNDATGEYIAVQGCPSEDSCTVDYRDGEWYVYRT